MSELPEEGLEEAAPLPSEVGRVNDRRELSARSGKGRPVTEDEFFRLYKQLKRKPESTDPHPLFGYQQAAARAYMACNSISRSEYRGVIGRMIRSAKTFRASKRSTNYFETALKSLGETA